MEFVETSVFKRPIDALLDAEQYRALQDALTLRPEAGAITRGERQPSRRIEITSLDINSIREGTKKSQNEFALMIGVSLGTLRNGEQGRRKPEGLARALLLVVAQNPAYVEQVLTH